MMRDNDFGVVRTRAFGTYDFHISDPKLFLKEVAGSDQHFRLEAFADTMRSRIVSLFSEALAHSHIPVLDVATRYSELGEALLPLINPVTMAKYGIEFTSFVVENISLPPEVEEAIDKRSSMTAVGNLNDYVKYQMAQGMAQPGGGGAGGMATEMAVGMAMAQQMMQQSGSPFMPPSGAPGAPARRRRYQALLPVRPLRQPPLHRLRARHGCWNTGIALTRGCCDRSWSHGGRCPAKLAGRRPEREEDWRDVENPTLGDRRFPEGLIACGTKRFIPKRIWLTHPRN